MKIARSNIIRAFICTVLLLSFTTSAYALDLDTSFDTDGMVITDIGTGTSDRAYSVAIQSDGKIVVAGESADDFVLARYTTAGELDLTFSTDGKVTTNFDGGTADRAYSVAIQSDGKIVVAGYAANDFALARYTTDGELDLTFSTDGKVTTDFDGFNDYGYSLAIQSDGKIVVVGESGNNFFALARYTNAGELDNDFGTAGLVTTDFNPISADRAYSVAIQSDGNIVVAGESADDFVLARYTTAGELDLTFGDGGKVTTNFGPGSNDYGYSVAIQSDGKIVVAGYTNDDFALARYTAAGVLDIEFGTAGKTIADFQFAESGRSVAIQSDGKIVVAGNSADKFALARYLDNGLLDTSFGNDNNGKVATDIGGINDDYGYSLAIQSDGKIVIAGYGSNEAGDNDFVLTRYGPANPVFSLSSNSESKTVNSSISGYTVSSTGGTISSYAISPAAPAGLTFNTTTGLLSGSPTEVAAATTYTITGINEMGSTTQTFTLTVTAQATTTDNSAALAAAAAEAAKRAKEQKELTEILSIIPKIGELTLGLGEVTKSLTSTQCVKGKTTKFVKKGSKCPKGFVRKK